MTTRGHAAAVAAFSMLLSVAACNKPPPPSSSSAIAVSPFVAIARGKVDVEGGLVHVASTREGVVRRVDGNVGDMVKAGEILLALDTTQADIARDAAKTEVVAAEAQTALLRSRLDGLKVRAARAHEAARAGAASDQSADEAKQSLIELPLEIAAAQAGVETAKQKLRQTEYEIAERTIRAPVAGKIVARSVRAGDTVAAAALLIDLLPEGPRIVRAELNESFVPKITVGMTAEVRSQSDTGSVYPAHVVRIGDVFGPSQLAEATQEATDARDVECILDIGTAPLRVGERVQVKFAADTSR